MTDKRALVTGAGGRLGQAMAIYLAGRGYDVAVHYASSSTGAENTAREIEALGRKAVLVQANLLNDDETFALFDKAVQGLGGPITCLVNNASTFEHDTVATATPESWERSMASNLRAPFWLMQKLAQQGLKAGTDSRGEPIATGLVVNMVDQRVRKLTPDFMTYTIAKMGLWTLTQTAARGLAPAIRVNAIGPGPTLVAERQSDEHFAQQRAATVLQRGSNPEDMCATLGYFLDSPAITGQLLCVDGGQHLGWQTPDIQGVE